MTNSVVVKIVDTVSIRASIVNGRGLVEPEIWEKVGTATIKRETSEQMLNDTCMSYEFKGVLYRCHYAGMAIENESPGIGDESPTGPLALSRVFKLGL